MRVLLLQRVVFFLERFWKYSAIKIGNRWPKDMLHTRTPP